MSIVFTVNRQDIEGVLGTGINRSGSANFSRRVRSAGVALNGFKFQFTNDN